MSVIQSVVVPPSTKQEVPESSRQSSPSEYFKTWSLFGYHNLFLSCITLLLFDPSYNLLFVRLWFSPPKTLERSPQLDLQCLPLLELMLRQIFKVICLQRVEFYQVFKDFSAVRYTVVWSLSKFHHNFRKHMEWKPLKLVRLTFMSLERYVFWFL